ncbi:MAG: hypothetical protein J0L84_09495 [Verrucomicrobia bacterium]|nr:hypothetical protein [Verrucomicrobiota bacterium]
MTRSRSTSPGAAAQVACGGTHRATCRSRGSRGGLRPVRQCSQPASDQRRPSARTRGWTALVTSLLLLGAAGCAAPGVAQQRLVSQPDMVFSTSAVWNFDQPLALQTESGRAFAGAGSASGCSSCK